MSAPAAASGATWVASIPCAATVESDLASLESRYRLALPSTLRKLFLDHSGQQVQPAGFWAQNVTNGLWRRESIGPLYPAGAVKKPASDDEEEDRYASYHVSVVNDGFADALLDQDELPPALATPAAAADTPVPVPHFAFSESPSSGHLIVLDTRTQNVMLLDVTRKNGPWIAAESVDAFLASLTDSDKPPSGGEIEEAEQDPFALGDDEEDEGCYCCDGCADEFGEVDTRYHCNQCENFDLCVNCIKSNGVGEDSHPASHTFTTITGGAADEEEKQ